MKIRPLILMVLILVIGFVIGILTSAQLRHKRMRPVRIYFSEQQFKEGLIKLIQPSDDQLEELEPLFKKYGRESWDLQREFRKNFDDIMDRYWDDIKPLLNAEQLQRLEHMEKRRRDATRRFKPDSLRIEGDSNYRGKEGSRGRRDDMPGNRYSPDRRDSRNRDSVRFSSDSLIRGDSLRRYHQ